MNLYLKAMGLIGALMICASAHAGTESHGAGGLLRGGQYITFYSAGFYIEPQPASDQLQVPQLNDLIAFISSMEDMSAHSKTKLLQAIIPTPARQYFKVDESRFDATTRARLLDEYARLVNRDRGDLNLFAITDTVTRRTYLLPSFYALKNPLEQMAILFHEAYWILNPKLDYKTVVDAEMAFQAVLEKPKDTLRLLEFMKYFSTAADRMKVAVSSDLRTQALPSSFRLIDLLGKDFFECKEATDKDCSGFALLTLHTYMQQYPKSAVLKAFQAAFVAGTLSYFRRSDGMRMEHSSFLRLSTCEIRMQVQTSLTNPENYGLRMACVYLNGLNVSSFGDDYAIKF